MKIGDFTPDERDLLARLGLFQLECDWSIADVLWDDDGMREFSENEIEWLLNLAGKK